MKIAILSDIHGNSWALSAVLTDIKSKNIPTIFNLGDSLYGPLDPRGTFELIMSNKMISISGNEDRMILESPDKKPDSPTLEYVKGNLPRNAFDWLRELPQNLFHENIIYGCHGIPSDDSVYLLECVEKDQITLKSNSEIKDLVKGIDQRIIVCGHSHISRVVYTEEKIIINPGSVGCPAFDDDVPAYHKMENHHNCAQYSILEVNGSNQRVEQIRVPYDYQSAAKAAILNNRPDWAKWVVTGRV